METDKLRLSQCMIVKDEEENIEKALSWGKGLVWEQVVVDTGSSDRTVELARSMGAKVFHFDWIDDFAAAKNFAISQAGGDWIVFLDADEYMEKKDAEQLPEVLKKAARLGLELVCMLCIQLGDVQTANQAPTQCRLFKNTPEIRYIHSVHEELAYNGGSTENHVLDDTELAIYHTGYQTGAMEKKNKRERNIRILLKRLENEPKNPDVMGYLGDSHIMPGDPERNREAEGWYRKALPFILRSKEKSQRDVYTVINLMNLLCHRRAENEMTELYRVAVSRFQGIYDFDYLAGRFYTEAGQHEKGAYYLERAFAGMEEYGMGTFNPLMPADIPDTLKALAVCYYEMHELGKCVNVCVAMLQADKSQVRGLGLLIRCFKDEEPNAVADFLQKLYDIHNISDRIFLLRGAVSAGKEGKGVLNVFRQYCTPQELAVLDQGGIN